MSTLSKRAATKAMTRKRRGGAHGLVLLGVSFIAGCVILPTTAGARPDAQSSVQPVAAVATLTTADFRVAVVAQRLSVGAAPTADVTVSVFERVDRGWRKLRELRLPETYFWQTVIGPRPICRLEIATARPRTCSRPSVTIQVLQSPSLGCDPSHRIPLPSR
jgi:hypothetical protein